MLAMQLLSTFIPIIMLCLSQCKDAAGHSTNAKKLKLDDLKFALRRPQQARQLARVEELLYLQEDIARARRNLDITYGAKGAAF